MNKDTGGPAFPLHNHGVQTLGMHIAGMTLRDYFAAKAIQAILHHYDSAFDDETADEDDVPFPELLAKDAYIMADAMLKVRNT